MAVSIEKDPEVNVIRPCTYNISNRLSKFVQNTNYELDVYTDATMSSIFTDNGKNLEEMITLKQKGVKIRYLTEVTRKNINYCKTLLKIVDELYHLEKLRGAFCVSENEYIAIIDPPTESTTNAIYSDAKELVYEHKHIFETFLSRSIPAEKKIREIENGLEKDSIQVIDGKKMYETIGKMTRSMKKEALLLLPNSASLLKIYEMGIIDYFINESKKRRTRIRIICPINKENSQIIKRISEESSNIKIFDCENADCCMLCVDNSEILVSNLEIPISDNLNMMSFTVYTENKIITNSFRTYFELLWKMLETTEESQMQYKMQTEFMSKASHEIRIAVEPILTYSELLQTEPENNKQEYLEAIFRNAKRLQRLTNNMLDLKRSEDQNFNLQKEWFDLNELISLIIEDFRNKFGMIDKLSNVRLKFGSEEQIFVKADKHMITQVVSNILDNALKFTANGEIAITCIKKDHGIIVTVKDTGSGIDPKILPHLFTKFTTMSRNGTGLGLYISKNIIESHKGTIFAENNSDGNGASFTFKLPNATKENMYLSDYIATVR